MADMRHMNYLSDVSTSDVEVLRKKEATYQGSWKLRGGVGAFMMMARKWDRMEGILKTVGKFGGGDKDAPQYDVFAWIDREVVCEKLATYPQIGSDGTVLAEVRDLRRYLLLVEAEMVARGVVVPEGMPKLDGGKDKMHVEERRPDQLDKIMKHVAVLYDHLEDFRFTYTKDAIKALAEITGVNELSAQQCEAVSNAADERQFAAEMPLRDAVAESLGVSRKDVDAAHEGATVVTNTPRAGESAEQTAMRDRRVPRQVPGTPEDGGQHAHESVTWPWIVRRELFTSGHESFRDAAYVQRGENCFLEPSLDEPEMFLLGMSVPPRGLTRENVRSLYQRVGSHYVLRVASAPAEWRDSWPVLRKECNAHEHASLPPWQQKLYEKSKNEGTGYRISPEHEAWTHGGEQ